MNIRINKLLLQNFKGIKQLEINADGESLTVYGDNATGKTTIFDAFTWLLFGKDSLGRSDFGIKTKDENGNVLHNLEHTVECELQIDKALLTLKKIYTEKWTKKRGSAEAEFSGHETKYFVNEVPVPKKDYEQKISVIIDETLFKIITNPLYFNEHLKWEDRRAILLNLCNNLSDEIIITQNEEFSPLSNELKGRTVQEYKKIIKSKQVAINDELKVIPQRISEASLAIPETIAEVDENEKASIEQKIADLNNEINAIKNGAGATDIENELRTLREQKRQIENEKCDVSDLENERNKYKTELNNVKFELADCEIDIRSNFALAENCKKEATRLREEWHKVNEKQYSESEICPTCNQPLPVEQVEKAKANFNTARANKLEEITEQGKKAKADADKYIAKHDASTKKLKELQEKKKDLEADILGVDIKISDITNNFADKIKKELIEIDNRIAETEKKAQIEAENIEPKIYTINEQITTEKQKLDEINKVIASRDIAEKQKQRIAELEADEKRLATEYAELEKIAFLIDEFIKFKVNMLSEEINSHFKYAKFKLFDMQINGGIAECCETTFNGVPYSDLNNAGRIKTGLDIIETLSKLYDKHAVIIIDNAESVNDIPETVSQQIKLYVSKDKQLRVERVDCIERTQ